jgi:hypothetical protein
MAQIPGLPITMIASVRGGTVNITRNYNNSSSVYNNYPYEFSCTLDITPLSTSEDTKLNSQFQFDAYDLNVGMWLLQPNGWSYKIISINTPNSQTEIQVTLQDVNLFNVLNDPSFSGFNDLSTGVNGLIFTLSDDGDPIIPSTATLSASLPSSNYWINDAYARFQYRNLTTTYYNNDDTNLVYSSGYSVNQVV